MNSVYSSGKTFAPSTHIKVVNASRRLDVDLNVVPYRPRVDEAVDSMNPPGIFVLRSHPALVDCIVRFAVEIAQQHCLGIRGWVGTESAAQAQSVCLPVTGGPVQGGPSRRARSLIARSDSACCSRSRTSSALRCTEKNRIGPTLVSTMISSAPVSMLKRLNVAILRK